MMAFFFLQGHWCISKENDEFIILWHMSHPDSLRVNKRYLSISIHLSILIRAANHCFQLPSKYSEPKAQVLHFWMVNNDLWLGSQSLYIHLLSIYTREDIFNVLFLLAFLFLYNPNKLCNVDSWSIAMVKLIHYKHLRKFCSDMRGETSIYRQ